MSSQIVGAVKNATERAGVGPLIRRIQTLIRLDTRLFDQLRPLRDLGLDDRSELIGRVADCFQPQSAEFGAQRCPAERRGGHRR